LLVGRVNKMCAWVNRVAGVSIFASSSEGCNTLHKYCDLIIRCYVTVWLASEPSLGNGSLTCHTTEEVSMLCDLRLYNEGERCNWVSCGCENL
jgi:hypothetical protein